MRRWLFIIILFAPILCIAQTYRYLGVEDGLSNRQVYRIQKDQAGYMWFLTHEGIDRYNGKDFKPYKLKDNGVEVNSRLNLNWLYIDSTGVLWQIGKKGRIFKYNRTHDRFDCVYKLPEESHNESPTPVSFGWIDRNNRIWLCNDKTIFLYNTQNGQVNEITNQLQEAITGIEQSSANQFFIGTETGVYQAKLDNNALNILPCKTLDDIHLQVNDLYFDQTLGKLFIGSFQRGVTIYDTKTETSTNPSYNLSDVSISRIKPLNKQELLIATDGGGVYKMDAETYTTAPYIVADYNSNNGMNGNSINDIYIDEENRIWMANHPIGITVLNNRYSGYQWIKHSIGNKQSLINDQVNAIIEDSDGDLWFGTNNGISLLNSQTGEWTSFLSDFGGDRSNRNHTFLKLCEVKPGIIWAGGYTSGIYEINKRTLKSDYFTPLKYTDEDIKPDKYIRDIYKDSTGYIWVGGYYNLKYFDIENNRVRLYPELNSITAITAKNSREMWIGTANGLFLLDKESGKFKNIPMPVESLYVYSLYQAADGTLYIGTSGSGLLVYHPAKDAFTHYYTENTALISNNIYTILSDKDEHILLATESGLTSFYPQSRTFHNWTKEMGLMTTHFNSLAGTLRKNNHFILGSVDGAVEFHKDMRLPRGYTTKMVLSDFRLFYETVYPGEKDSPLEDDIDRTKELRLKYNQNIFSLMVSSINYDYPSNILYSWKLEGFYDEWSTPGTENIIRYTNLAPGRYTLRIRAVSNEDKRIVLEEKSMDIVVAKPFWLTLWAMLAYLTAGILVAATALRFLILRKQRKTSEEKIQFFVNTAHDIRTPLTLIKAPLEDIADKEKLSKEGNDNIGTALRNVNALLQLTTNLINFEKADVYSSELSITEHELSTFMNDLFNSFQPYAKAKNIRFTYESNFSYLNVWFDREKMESILKNLISNAIKYTPENGNVLLSATDGNDTWHVEVRDTGIGIPAKDRKNLFKLHFRGSNAVNSKVTGSGIGLMLAWKLVRLHGGKLKITSTENKGTSVRITFPKECKKLTKRLPSASTEPKQPDTHAPNACPPAETVQKPLDPQHQRILIVEDNDELRNYLRQTLSDNYTVQTCPNGKEALALIPQYKPELVISDIMMPEMRGDELCTALKSNIETSHIPVILLTALSNEKDILSSLQQTGADEHISKPFSIGILKATIGNLLRNRALLRQKYANLEIDNAGKEQQKECPNCMHDIDREFIANVRKQVEENITNPALNVDLICNLVGMSRTSFYNKLRALTDQAPADFIRLIRLKRAAQLLRESEYSITEIAEMTGFNDPKYFREVFKKRYNMNPTQYSKECKKHAHQSA